MYATKTRTNEKIDFYYLSLFLEYINLQYATSCMTNMAQNYYLEQLENECKEFLEDDQFVYKSCNNIDNIDNIDISIDTNPDNKNLKREWLIILKKLKGTKTNEARFDIIDATHAKYRADKLMVVKIVNIINPKLTKDYIINRYDDFKLKIKIIETKYEVNKIVTCDKYNQNIDVVCGGGIHYFKTLISAYYYDICLIKPNYTGTYFVWHDNGTLSVNVEFKDGKLNGHCIGWFSLDKRKSFECDYKNDKKEGYLTKWHSNGQKMLECIYKNDKEDGKQIVWHSNGQKATEGAYKNGKRNGYWCGWHFNGQKAWEGDYANDNQDGHWIEWHYNGQKITMGRYENGVMEGYWIIWYFDGSGKKEREGTYVNGKQEGCWQEWDHNGQTRGDYYYKNGKCDYEKW